MVAKQCEVFCGKTNRALLNADLEFLRAESAQYDTLAEFIKNDTSPSTDAIPAQVAPSPVRGMYILLLMAKQKTHFRIRISNGLQIGVLLFSILFTA